VPSIGRVNLIAACALAALTAVAHPGLRAAAQSDTPDLAPVAPAGLDATNTLSADQDSFVSSGRPDENFGSNSKLYVGDTSSYGATRTVIGWDMSQLAAKNAVTKAKIRLYLRDAGPSGDSGHDVVVRRLTSSWKESNVTWNAFPSFDNQILASTNIGTTTGGWYEWTVTDPVKAWRWPQWQKTAKPNYGVYVQGYEANGSYRAFDSSEGSNAPQLEITNQVDTVAPTSKVDMQPLYINQPDKNQNYATVKLTWTGTDPEPATGIDYFLVLLKINNGGFDTLKDSKNTPTDQWRRYDTTYQAQNGKVLNFVSYATDMAGNQEPNKPNPDTIVHVDWSPPVTTLTALPANTNTVIPLSWTGQDMPNGSDEFPAGIASYTVWFNINNTTWGKYQEGLTGTSTTFTPSVDCATYQFQVTAVDKAGNVQPVGASQAQTYYDSIPPAVTMSATDPAPPYTSFTVNWTGVDCATIKSYDVQYRIGLGAWQDWVTGTSATSKVFDGQKGNVYGFRSRALDAAGNLGVYPPDPQVSVALVDPATLTVKLDFPWAGK
jgi:hypothetical protein